MASNKASGATLTDSTFRKASERRATRPAKVALAGPSGSGKSFTAIELALGLVGGNAEDIAVIDSEHGTAALYADRFGDFLHADLQDYAIQTYLALCRTAVEAGVKAVVIDSATHAWNDVLRRVDDWKRTRKGRDERQAWAEVQPDLDSFNTMIQSCPVHLVVTFRTKNEWVNQKDEKTGRNRPEIIGLAPRFKEGVEHEFDIYGELTMEHDLVIRKSRYDALDGEVYRKPSREIGETLLSWIKADPQEEPEVGGGVQPGGAAPPTDETPTEEQAAEVASLLEELSKLDNESDWASAPGAWAESKGYDASAMTKEQTEEMLAGLRSKKAELEGSEG